MAETNFSIFKVPDRKLLDIFLKIAESLDVENSNSRFNFSQKGGQQLSLHRSELKNDDLQSILSLEPSVLTQIQMTLSYGTLTVVRQEGSDEAKLSYHDQLDAAQIAKLSIAAHIHLPVYAPTESIDKLLKDRDEAQKSKNRKRILIHNILFLGLIGVFGGLLFDLIPGLLTQPNLQELIQDPKLKGIIQELNLTEVMVWVPVFQRFISVAALALTLVYYIRWNNQWFHNMPMKSFVPSGIV